MEFKVLDKKVGITEKHLISYLYSWFVLILFSSVLSYVSLFYINSYQITDFSDPSPFLILVYSTIKSLIFLIPFILFFISKYLKYDFSKDDALPLAFLHFCYPIIIFIFWVIFTFSLYYSSSFPSISALFVGIFVFLSYLLDSLVPSAIFYIILYIIYNQKILLEKQIVFAALAITIIREIFSNFTIYVDYGKSLSNPFSYLTYYFSPWALIALLHILINTFFIINYFILYKGKISKYFYYIFLMILGLKFIFILGVLNSKFSSILLADSLTLILYYSTLYLVAKHLSTKSS